MKNNLIKIYALAVCFVTISCIAITSGFALHKVAIYVWPELGIESHVYAAYRSTDSYRNSPHLYSVTMAGYRRAVFGLNRPGLTITEQSVDQNTDPRITMTDEEVEILRISQYAELLHQTIFDATKSLLRYIIILVVCAPLFFIHWRIAKRE